MKLIAFAFCLLAFSLAAQTNVTVTGVLVSSTPGREWVDNHEPPGRNNPNGIERVADYRLMQTNVYKLYVGKEKEPTWLTNEIRLKLWVKEPEIYIDGKWKPKP